MDFGFIIQFTIFPSKIIPLIIYKLIQIENILVGREIVKGQFACDLEKCKGACCTLDSEYGAPIKPEELEKIDSVLDAVKEYLPKAHKREIESKGFYEKKDNEMMIRSFNNKACVFVHYENNIAKCGIEKAFLDGKSNFRKPISCHLFPIRVSDFGGDVLRFEKFDECLPALAKGKLEKINLLDFCKDSLIRKYSENWFLKLKEITDHKC